MKHETIWCSRFSGELARLSAPMLMFFVRALMLLCLDVLVPPPGLSNYDHAVQHTRKLHASPAKRKRDLRGCLEHQKRCKLACQRGACAVEPDVIP